MFLNFDKTQPQRSYKKGSYKRKRVYIRWKQSKSEDGRVQCDSARTISRKFARTFPRSCIVEMTTNQGVTE